MKVPEVIIKALGDTGEISFGRFASFITLIFCLGWDSSFICFSMRHLDFTHMSIGDILPSGTALLAQAGFCTVFFGLTKAKDVLTQNNPENGQK